MNNHLRHVMVALLGCFVLLFLQLNRVQVFQAEALRENPANTRTLQQDFDQQRGVIRTSDGVVVALSEQAAPGGPFNFQRTYPHGDLYAHSVGFIAFTVGGQGVERAYNDEILGRTAEQQLADLASILDPDSSQAGALTLTIDHELQQVAKAQLGEREGSVVAIDPRTGAIRALWSYPSFDPNLVANNDSGTANAAYVDLLEAEGNPLRARAYRDIEFPGSTFKVVTAGAALETGAATLTEPVFEATTEYTAPLTSRPITNFGGRACGGDLVEILVQSCNAPFAELAAEVMGPFVLTRQAVDGAGFNTELPLDIPGSVPSVFPDDYGALVQNPSDAIPAGVYENTPLLAQTAIGQNEVQASPLHMALIISGIANDGLIPTPHVVAEVADANGRVVDEISPGGWRRSMEVGNAEILQEALIQAGLRGTGTNAAVDGLVVGVKTGTAQLGTDPPASNAWIIGFAGREQGNYELAVAVLVEGSAGNGDQTGGAVAGPIAREIFSTWFANETG
ncbi:MAG: penicillin-binding transpeptidase domain-containing protein [Actinomycetota bacterium]